MSGHWLLKNALNTLATLFLIIVIAGTTFGSSFLVLKKPVLPGDVAGISLNQDRLQIIPNRHDFNDYVSYTAMDKEGPAIKLNAFVSSFSNYLAVYNRLYEIRNLNPVPITLQAGIGELPDYQPYQQLVTTIFTQEETSSTRLQFSESPGATLIEVDRPQIFLANSHALLGEEIVTVRTIGAKTIVTSPLKQPHEAGEKIYPRVIAATPDGVLSSSTGNIEVGPHQSAFLSLFVRGNTDPENQTLPFPLQLNLLIRP